VVNWTNEEGSRYAPAMIASGVFAGVYTQDYAYGLKDADGKAFGEELKRIGYVGPEPVGKRPLKAFFELHIEQGPILEAEGVDIGVVTHGQGQRWFDVKLTGFESHAGSTPMPRRRDALLGAAKLVQAVNEIALAKAPHGVGTVGVLDPYPGSRNVIPGAVSLTVDFRHPVDTTLAEMKEAFSAAVARICDEGRLASEVQEVFYYAPVAFDLGCVDAVRRAAERLGYSHRDIVSGAGHDACYVARVAPTAMIFCPCVDGVSHNEEEKIYPEWAAAGANVLFHAAVETAEIVS
jgi:N-carbamoyl-L-amino-acid hydrolase